MGNIHYFQRYSQKENVVTNNTLLLFSRLHVLRPGLFDVVLNGLLELEEEAARLRVGPTFQQQKRAGAGGIPDGDITQAGWRVLIETKLGNSFTVAQIEGHLKKFLPGERKLLLLLGNEPMDTNELTVIRTAAQVKVSDIQLVYATFEQLITLVREELDDWDEDLSELIEDYAEFCSDEELLPYSKFVLHAVTSGDTFHLNRRHGIYFDDASNGYQAHTYLGLYTDKEVKAVGKLENIISVEFIAGEFGTPVSNMNITPSTAQLDRIKDMIEETESATPFTPSTQHRFFVVDEFYDTSFRKTSKGGARRGRYFDLREWVTMTPDLPGPEEIARQLNGQVWG